MKRNELIAKLQELPEDAEITIINGDDILGYYFYSDILSLVETECIVDRKGCFQATYSNGLLDGDDELRTIWVIE
jgi:hypothetical protein